jgi:M6 family metalloprotease-like protein
MKLTTLATFAIFTTTLTAAEREAAPTPKKWPDITGFKSAKDAIRADAKTFPPTGKTGIAVGTLGLALTYKDRGVPVIDDVLPGSAAEKAGLKVGDVIDTVDGDSGTAKLRGRLAGDTVKIALTRGDAKLEVAAKFEPLSKPMNVSERKAIMGIQTNPPRKEGGVEISGVNTDGGAASAGLKSGDIILKINDRTIDADLSLQDALGEKTPGERVTVTALRGMVEKVFTVTLSAPPVVTIPASWDDRLPSTFRKPTYKLAILGVEYPDVKHSDTITGKDWENALFSRGTYTNKNASGSTVYGSMADYYHELSYGKLKIEGKFVGWFEVGKKKMEYNLGNSVTTSDKAKFFSELMDKAVAKLGKDPLKDYDGVFIVFAGDGVQTSRGGLYWPHRARFTHDKKQYSYFIVPEARRGKMTDISVICHEFGHMLGLPDLYARPENPGSEGVGVWDAMSNQLPNGRPQHFSAWSKEQMGWLNPVVIDPRVKQKLILAPIEDSASECLKVMVRADGSEYFLLENRQKKGWDKELPADGLLIWRVLPGSNRGTQQVYLEEAHGVEGPTGPRVFTGAVPFPNPANHSFTRFTTPSSKSQLGGGLDVSITQITRLPDGRIALRIGYEYQ